MEWDDFDAQTGTWRLPSSTDSDTSKTNTNSNELETVSSSMSELSIQNPLEKPVLSLASTNLQDTEQFQQQQMQQVFLKAIMAGSYHVISTILLHDIHDVTFNDNEALRLAVLFNRKGIVELLLTHGANPNGLQYKDYKAKKLKNSTFLSMACSAGYSSIAKILCKFGAQDREKALIVSVSSGNASCINVLAEAKTDMRYEQSEAVFIAFNRGATHMMSLLFNYGISPDARDGEMIIESAGKGGINMIKFLISKGADPNIREGEAIRQAIINHHSSALELLLNNGADEVYVDEDQLDYYTRQTFTTWKRKNRFLRLKRAVKSSFNRDTWKWQHMARAHSEENFTHILQQAKLFNISDILTKSKRQLCIDLALKTEPIEARNKMIEGTDLYGTLFADLPAWKLYIIGDVTFNIFDLVRLVKRNFSICPYTRLPLPTREIEERRKFLECVLTRTAYNDTNLVEQVSEMPLITKEMELKSILLNQVFDRISYHPSPNFILNANDILLADMIRKLFLITSDVLMYPMLTFSKKLQLQNAVGIFKKESFIKTLAEITSIQDEYRQTRIQMLNILFQHYHDDGTTRQGSPDDLLSFMIEDAEDSDDDDDDEVTGSILSNQAYSVAPFTTSVLTWRPPPAFVQPPPYVPPPQPGSYPRFDWNDTE